MKEITITNMKELDYRYTANVSQCKEILSLFLPLNEVIIARIVGVVVRTQSGLEDDKNVLSKFHAALCGGSSSDLSQMTYCDADILIYAIKQLAPTLNWVTIMENLDHEGFYIPNEAAFYFLMSVYKHANQDRFPLRAICGSIWENAEGQISFLKYAVSSPPEVFTFAHSGRQLAYFDVVIDHKVQTEQANHAWLCLDLLEVLCQLAERDYASSVRPILEHPLKHCPEVLLLGMAHINTASNLLQQEVSSAVFPILLQNADASAMIVHLWHANPSIFLRGLVEALRIDPENMDRFLAACQEIKILSPVLDMIPYSFGVRLASLASCKELIDLEKWLSSNLITYKDAFYEECIKYLKEVHLAAQDVTSNRFHSNALRKIYSETSSTFLKVLQSHSFLVTSPHLSAEMDKLHVTYMGTIKSAGSADLSASDCYSDDTEAEANLYFHQLFCGQLTNDTMIRMLARFKESTEKREQVIFRCMIVKLFTKSFAKYPDRQLMAAVLFGSLIKNQLITHHTLEIALLAVLDALRKFPCSKMFVFGIRALEQFVDRLIEWPHYCNRILKITRFRETHPELVTVIEQALARISQEPAGHCPAADVYFYDDGIEAEARLYFNQMFTGQLTVDAMIQMLARFKGSIDNRDQAIFQCMIVMPFSEIKFLAILFQEKPHKIVAAFIGSVIKNHLVTYHTLDIALQEVLDSLREPSCSKRFLFGITALAQFVSRLIEWPQYCNRILQISHLRASHPELLVSVEHALSKISQARASHRPALVSAD